TLREAMLAGLDAVTAEEPVVLCGSSLGGAVALGYAAARPERVRGLVLLSPAGARMTHEEMRRLVAWFDMKDVGDARRFMETIYHRPPWFLPLLAPSLLDVVATPALRGLRTAGGP